MDSDIKLSNLQKLALNYFMANLQLKYVSAMHGNLMGLQLSMNHDKLVYSILGEDIVEMLKDPEEVKSLQKQAVDFYKLMALDLEEENETESF